MVITVSEPVTGRVISTLNALVPPPNEPFPLGKMAGDRRPPGIESIPEPLTGFDPTSPRLSFTFSEGVTRDSVEAPGAVRGSPTTPAPPSPATSGKRSNENKTVTFLPSAPLRLKTGYTITFSNIRDASDNTMRRADFRISTIGPSLVASEQRHPESGPTDSAREEDAARRRHADARIRRDRRPREDPCRRDSRSHRAGQSRRPEHDSDGGRRTGDSAAESFSTVDGTLPGGHPPQDDVVPCGHNAGLKSFTGDLLIVTTYSVGFGSAIRFYDITDPQGSARASSDRSC